MFASLASFDLFYTRYLYIAQKAGQRRRAKLNLPFPVDWYTCSTPIFDAVVAVVVVVESSTIMPPVRQEIRIGSQL